MLIKSENGQNFEKCALVTGSDLFMLNLVKNQELEE